MSWQVDITDRALFDPNEEKKDPMEYLRGIEDFITPSPIDNAMFGYLNGSWENKFNLCYGIKNGSYNANDIRKFLNRLPLHTDYGYGTLSILGINETLITRSIIKNIWKRGVEFMYNKERCILPNDVPKFMLHHPDGICLLSHHLKNDKIYSKYAIKNDYHKYVEPQVEKAKYDTMMWMGWTGMYGSMYSAIRYANTKNPKKFPIMKEYVRNVTLLSAIVFCHSFYEYTSIKSNADNLFEAIDEY